MPKVELDELKQHPESTTTSASRRVILAGVHAFIGPDLRDFEVGKVEPSLRIIINQLRLGLCDWPLLIWGDVGAGKTYAGWGMCKHFGGWFVDLPELCRMDADAKCGRLQYSSGYGRSHKELWDDWGRANLTVLDEIGLRRDPSDAHYETLKHAIDSRHLAAAVFITNLSSSEIADVYDDRIASRLFCGTVHRLRGDQRMKREG